METASFDHATALLACARGDERAFHQLYDHEAPHMLVLCRRLVPHDAEGLVHDTFALIWRHADQYDAAMGPARAWIYSVLRHLARARLAATAAGSSVMPPELPPATAVRGEIARLVRTADGRAYDAIAHAYLHGADYRRVAGWLHCSEAELRRSTQAALRGLPA